MASIFSRIGDRVLGVNIKKPTPNTNRTNKILTTNDDGSTIIESVGPLTNHGYWDSNYTFTTERDLIRKFRDMSLNTYCDRVINEIVNTCISFEDESGCNIELDLDKVDVSDTLKEHILDEWNNVLSLLDFKNNGQSIFREWYIDGRIFYQKIVNKDNIKEGIIEIRRIDSLDIKKIKQIERKIDEETGALIISEEKEYFLYTPENDYNYAAGSEILLPLDAVAYSSSGLYIYKDEPVDGMSAYNTNVNNLMRRYVVSYLFPMIKPLNQLNIVEEAGLINLVARAPERRVHYVDVAGLPKSKAEEALREYAKSIKNTLQYDTTTGTFNSDINVLSMQDDLIIPRRNGTNAAEITSLPGVQTNNNVDIITYFRRKFYMSSHVALSRLNDDTPSFLGRASEINRDELNMSKFCNNLRMKFVELPLDLLRTQLILKNYIKPSDWKDIKKDVVVRYSSDTYISQLRQLDLTQEKLNILREIEPYIGKFYSKSYVQKYVLGFSEDEITKMEEQIEEEGSNNPAPETPNNDMPQVDDMNSEIL